MAYVVQPMTGLDCTVDRRNRRQKLFVEGCSKPCELCPGQPFNAPAVEGPVSQRIFFDGVIAKGICPCASVGCAVVKNDAVGVESNRESRHTLLFDHDCSSGWHGSI